MTVIPPTRAKRPAADVGALSAEIDKRFGAAVALLRQDTGADLSFLVQDPAFLPALCEFLATEANCWFAGVMAEEGQQWRLCYLFLSARLGSICILLPLLQDACTAPSISARIHAADWYEREVEDLFGIEFEGHPRLGDFVLHDQVWQERIAPMRKSFDPYQRHFKKQPQTAWRPTLVVRDPGAFAMPVGPVYEGGLGESIHFLLETVGEDVVRALPRLFYHYRAVEKIAQGKYLTEGLLLAERFSAKSAFAHSLAYCQAVEQALHLEVPVRAQVLRLVLCELERIRHHAGVIEGICQSTALSVAQAHAAIAEEELLRASCAFAGHRYLYGLNTVGGLRRDFDSAACRDLLRALERAGEQLERLDERLRLTSSFLDRLEDVGIVSPEAATDLNLVGPVGRASGLSHDLRRLRPYCGYRKFRFQVPCESEGDGYARLRILFAEIRESSGLILQALESLEPGSIVCDQGPNPAPGVGIGWVEAPIGAAIHCVCADGDGRLERYRILSPSFRNFLGLHVAVENFAFQDFPIILATFGLSATECDR